MNALKKDGIDRANVLSHGSFPGLVFAGLWWLVLLGTPGAASSELPLPTLEHWARSGVDRDSADGRSELRLTRMFQPGGLASPSVEVEPGQRLTLSAKVETEYRSKSGYYLFWLTLEFLDGDKLVKLVESSPIRGTSPDRLLAVTGLVPSGANAVRATIKIQNRTSRVLPNRAKVGEVRLELLPLGTSGEIKLDPLVAFPTVAGVPRTAKLRVSSDSPDGSAVALATTRGTITPSVVLSGGRGEAEIIYESGVVGETTITATIDDRSAKFTLPDASAGRITIDRIEVDGVETPALVQLIVDGKVRPGRYSSIPGEFIRTPWTAELAPGLYKVRVSSGPQVESIEREVSVERGRSVNLGQFSMKRRGDLRRYGWYGGDPDGDVYHGERIYTDVTEETAERIARAVGLDWITPANWGEPGPKTWRDARAVMAARSDSALLFRFADEKKWHTGHFCFVGLDRPDNEGFETFWDTLKRLNPSEGLQAVRTSGAATFANHPVRYWMSGVNNETFVTNMYANMPFDVAAGGLLDGININEGGEPALKLWSLLLDHGYRVAATAGADFSLDHPGGWLPGLSRLYIHAPNRLDERAIVDAIRRGATIVSTGPMLIASVDDMPPGSVVNSGRPHRIQVRGWARHDRGDRLKRVELWAHDRVQQGRDLDGTEAEVSFDWAPTAEYDWVSVRLVAESGWAMTSAFYATNSGWEFPRPVVGKVAAKIVGLPTDKINGAVVEVWENRPDAPGSRVLRTVALGDQGRVEVDAPVTATIRLKLRDGRHRDVRFYDASGVSAMSDVLSKGAEKEAPLLRWETYEEVLRRCRKVDVVFSF